MSAQARICQLPISSKSPLRLTSAVVASSSRNAPQATATPSAGAVGIGDPDDATDAAYGAALLAALDALKRSGNSIFVVEHDLAAALGQVIIEAINARTALHFFQNALVAELLKTASENRRRCPQARFEIRKAVRPVKGIADNQQRPFVADQVSGTGKAAIEIFE